MNRKFKADKQHIRRFIQEKYKDDTLVELLHDCRSSKFDFCGSYCLIGRAVEQEQIRSMLPDLDRLTYARSILGGRLAELAIRDMAGNLDGMERNRRRERILIPMVLAEIKRRQRSREVPESIPEMENTV